MAKKKYESSSVRMRKAGYKPMLLWLTAEQHEKVFRAAKIDGRKPTQAMIFHGLKALENILEKSSKNT